MLEELERDHMPFMPGDYTSELSSCLATTITVQHIPRACLLRIAGCCSLAPSVGKKQFSLLTVYSVAGLKSAFFIKRMKGMYGRVEGTLTRKTAWSLEEAK